MRQIPELNSIFFLFYLFGQISYIPFEKSEKSFRWLLTYIPKLIYFLVLITTIFSMITLNHKWPDLSEFSTIISCLLLIFYVLSNFASLLTDLFDPLSSYLLCDYLADTIHYTEKKFKLKISMAHFRKIFYRKVLFAFSIEILISLENVISKSMFLKTITDVVLLVAKFYRYFSLFHSIIFIDLMIFVLFSLNTNLRNINENPLCDVDLLQTFRHLKWIHYSLSKVSRLFNKRLYIL